MELQLVGGHAPGDGGGVLGGRSRQVVRDARAPDSAAQRPRVARAGAGGGGRVAGGGARGRVRGRRRVGGAPQPALPPPHAGHAPVRHQRRGRHSE